MPYTLWRICTKKAKAAFSRILLRQSDFEFKRAIATHVNATVTRRVPDDSAFTGVR
jgi:hypothetical protein